MTMTYANIQDRVEQILQDTTAATYTTAMTGMWIEDALKEFSLYDPHIVDTIFKIESRTGADTAGGTSVLTDTTKSQFIATVEGLQTDSSEKVIHNTTENTWATSSAATDATTEVITLNADIMNSGDNYEIYNRRCWNKKQIYLGNPTDIRHDPYLWVDSVEYPIGTKRNFKIYGDVLEIDVDSVADSDSTLDPPNDVDVLVRFAKPHRLCQMTDLQGALKGNGLSGGLAIVAYNFTIPSTTEVGDEFHIANHKTLYTVTEEITWWDSVNGNVLYFFPVLEATATADDVIYFTKSTLKPQHEELFCHLVAARAVLSLNIINIDAINKGGTDVWLRYQNWGERKLAEVIGKMERLSPPRTKRRYSPS